MYIYTEQLKDNLLLYTRLILLQSNVLKIIDDR